jgi:putative transposase
MLKDKRKALIYVSVQYNRYSLRPKSTEYLAREFPELEKRYCGMHIWARGYCVSTVGINEEVIREYIRKQQEEEETEEQRRLWKDNSE